MKNVVAHSDYSTVTSRAEYSSLLDHSGDLKKIVESRLPWVHFFYPGQPAQVTFLSPGQPNLGTFLYLGQPAPSTNTYPGHADLNFPTQHGPAYFGVLLGW